MPDYPITFVATFAVNGVMVVIVFICLAAPTLSTHAVKINLSLFLSGVLSLLIPLASAKLSEQLTRFWIVIFLMLFTGAFMGAALAQTLSYMSFMPEHYMALNSMGIGVSGLVSLAFYSILLSSYADKDFTMNLVFFILNFVMMTAISSLYFFECNSNFAQYYIRLSAKDNRDETKKEKMKA